MDIDLYIAQPAKKPVAKKRQSDNDTHSAKKKSTKASRTLAPLRSLPLIQPIVRILTLCSGIEAIIQAAENLSLDHAHVGACEVDAATRKTLLHNFSPKQMFEDLREIPLTQIPAHDMLWAGFPCQPFSPEGVQAGCLDANGRGLIILYIVRIIAWCMPALVVLENVAALAVSVRFRDFFESVISLLRDIKSANGVFYYVHWKVLDTKYFGVPQSRPRVYIVLVRSDVRTAELVWPTPSAMPCKAIDRILSDPKRSPAELATILPPASQKHARRIHAQAIAEIKSWGRDPFQDTFIVELDGRATSLNIMEGTSPCLTRSRAAASGHWITTRGRRFDTDEMLHLQHMCPLRITRPSDVSLTRFHAMIGNSMSVNILQKVLISLSNCSPIVLGSFVDS